MQTVEASRKKLIHNVVFAFHDTGALIWNLLVWIRIPLHYVARTEIKQRSGGTGRLLMRR